jgi:hypothetical protein
MHVSTPDSEVEAEMRSRCAKARKDGKEVTDEQEQEVVDLAIGYHHENRGLYNAVMSGRF